MSTHVNCRRLALAEALAVALLVTACGGGDADPTAEVVDSPPTSESAEPLGGLAAPEAALAEREAPGTASCPAPAFATPKVAAWDTSRDETPARQQLLARFSLAIVSMPADAARIDAFAKGVKAINPSALLAQYLTFPEVRSAPASTDYAAPLATAATANGWWLKDASGKPVSWTGGATWGINPTAWTRADANGRRYPQFRAAYDHKSFYANANGLDYVFVANTWARPRVDADWRMNGTHQSRLDETVQSAMRAGYVAYWSALRGLKPSIKVMGGLDNTNDLSAREYDGQLDGAFVDGLIGKDWSIEKGRGWDAAMAQYRSALAHTRGDRKVIFVSYGASPTDYATMRYALASALMDDGLFMFVPASGSVVPAWYDEYSAPLGKPVDTPPAAAAANGVWLRRFENGIVLVNPSKTDAASIDVGAGYKRLAGTQDPAVNNGAEQALVTLGPRQGLLMLKVPAPCKPTVYAKPKVAALDYSRDTTLARQELLAKYRFVILSFTKGMASQLQTMAAALKERNPAVEIAQYTAMNETLCYPKTTQDQYDIATEVTRNNWWLRTADGQRVQWTTEYHNCDINFGAYSLRNDRGQTFAQWKWQRDYGLWFGRSPDVDYVFIDNVWHATRNDADWKRVKLNLPADTPEANRIMRQGYADYVNNVHTATPGMKVIGNVNHDLDYAEYDHVLDAAFIEGLIGKSWSLETWAGWDSMMAVYRGALKRTRIPGNVFLNTFAEPTDYRTIRYGLASALLEDGYHLHIPASGTFKPNWIDDYDAPIGDAAEAPPTAPARNGIWMRRYTNGIVLVNPSRSSSASIDVGPGYRRLSGTQDPAVNNGRAESVVTLGPREGLLMIRP